MLVLAFVAIVTHVQGQYYKSQAMKWESKYHEEVRRHANTTAQLDVLVEKMERMRSTGPAIMGNVSRPNVLPTSTI